MDNYLEKQRIKEIVIDNEIIYLKKHKWFGWNIIYPSKINNKTNWKNFLIGGSWLRFILIILIIIIVLGCVYEYSIALKTANECLNQTRLDKIILDNVQW